MGGRRTDDDGGVGLSCPHYADARCVPPRSCVGVACRGADFFAKLAVLYNPDDRAVPDGSCMLGANFQKGASVRPQALPILIPRLLCIICFLRIESRAIESRFSLCGRSHPLTGEALKANRPPASHWTGNRNASNWASCHQVSSPFVIHLGNSSYDPVPSSIDQSHTNSARPGGDSSWNTLTALGNRRCLRLEGFCILSTWRDRPSLIRASGRRSLAHHHHNSCSRHR